jgi:NAD(P)-dependent dehydrogenase (short-subunit alcohol dehydrogenase family)
MSRLKNKVAVITGGNSGIGKSIAKKFKNEGAKVVIFGRNEETLNQAKAEIGEDLLAVKGDVTNSADLENLFSLVKEKYGKIDTLVVNAGSAKMIPLEATTEDVFDSISNVNFKGAFFTVQKALHLLSEGSNVTLISSVANVKGIPGMSVYSASKAASRSLARSFAAELAPKGIRVNSLSPGPIDTPIFDRMGLPEGATEDAKESFKGQVPMQRLAQPEEMASVALFLSSEDSSFVTGADIAADGGLAQV